MPVSLTERIDSPTAEGDDAPSSATKHYTMTGTTDESTVSTLILSSTPTTYLGLSRIGYTLNPLSDDIWDIYVKYGRKEVWSVQFDTTGGTQHLQASYATPGAYFAAGVTAFSCNGSIGVTKDSVEGIDVATSQFGFTVTRQIPVGDLTDAYLLDLVDLTGKVNDAVWIFFVQGVTLTFQPREVVFNGATVGTKNTDDEWQLSYKFSVSRGATGLTVGEITGITKAGWDYLWVYFSEDTDAGRLIKKPRAVFVEQVYLEADFNLLDFPPP